MAALTGWRYAPRTKRKWRSPFRCAMPRPCRTNRHRCALTTPTRDARLAAP